MRARLVQSIEAVAGLRPRLRQEVEGQVVELAVAIGRRILHRQLTIDPTAISGLVRSVLDGISLRELVCVRAHPALAPTVQIELERIGVPVAVRVEADPSLEAGGLLLETTSGVLDASVQTQIDEVSRGFADLLSSSTR